VTQDGSAAATVTDVRIGDDGKVIARYSNGVESDVAQLAVAAVRNPATLIAAGANAYRAAADSFVMPASASGTQGNGTIVGEALESSNVDLADQLTQLISYQRSYQANARSVTTADELMQETLSLKR
jgi:flagellar hook protein FlgE